MLSLAIGPVSAVGPDGANSVPAPRGDVDTDRRSKARAKAARPLGPAFHDAHRLIEQAQYERGIAALRALRRDMHPDVAGDLGFDSHKLGHYDDAQYWYEEALTANPCHPAALANYGIWHAEQGNGIKARDCLAKLEAAGNGDSKEYRALAAAIERAGLS